MSRRVNVIIVPDEGGRARRYSLSVFWIKFATVVFAVFLVGVVAGSISYSFLAKRAIQYSALRNENLRLEMENKRIIQVAQEVDQSRRILAQIIRSLGGHLDLGTPEEGDSLNLDETLLQNSLNVESPDLLHPTSFAAQRLMMHGLPTQMPVKGFITQTFFEDYLYSERSHRGIDVASKTGSSITASAAGVVVFEGWTPRFGNCLMIAHDGGYMTFYGHNQINFKSVRDDVSRGEPVALLGNSGYSSAPHLHFEVWKDGVPVDPMEILHPETQFKVHDRDQDY